MCFKFPEKYIGSASSLMFWRRRKIVLLLVSYTTIVPFSIVPRIDGDSYT